MEKIYPKNAECLTYSDYEVEITKPSSFIKDMSITETIGFTCPNCKELLNPLKHGGTKKCKCGLRMQNFGNALYIWR